MKRTDITEIFPDAPKEAIDKLLSINGADVERAKGDLEGLRQQLAGAPKSEELQQAKDLAAQLQKELDGLKNAEAIRGIREKVAGEKKIPVHLLTGDTEEACANQADAILAFAQPSGYPQVPDGGEVTPSSQAKTRDKFAQWAAENL